MDAYAVIKKPVVTEGAMKKIEVSSCALSVQFVEREHPLLLR